MGNEVVVIVRMKAHYANKGGIDKKPHFPSRGLGMIVHTASL